MFKRNPNYSEWLLPYLEGGLDEAQSAQMKARLAADPALAGEADRLRRTLGHLRQSAERRPKAVKANVPADLWPRLRARLEPAPAPRRLTSQWITGAGAVAALAWAALWIPTLHLPDRTADRSHNPIPRRSPRPVMPPQKSVAITPRPNAASRHMLVPPAPVAPPLPAPAAPAGKQAVGVAGPKAPPPTLSAEDPFTLPVPPPHPKDAGHLSTPPSFPLSGRLTPAPSGRPTQMAPNGAGFYGSAAMAARKPQYDAPAPPPMTVPAPPPAAPAPTLAAPASDAAGSPAKASAGARDGSRPDAAPAPAPSLRAEADGLRQKHSARRAAPAATAGSGFAPSPDMDESSSLDAWQAALAQSAQPPLLGDTAGEQQANQALMAARESGSLETLRARLEAKRSQSPADIVTARMLAAVYDFGFQSESALRERRRLTGLDGAVGEDWFALGQAEEHAGNKEAARAAYRHALESPTPPASFHAALARQRSS